MLGLAAIGMLWGSTWEYPVPPSLRLRLQFRDLGDSGRSGTGVADADALRMLLADSAR
jgi:hypothetical protein